MPKLINQSCGDNSLLARSICSHLKVTRTLMDVWQASKTSHSKSSPGNFQHQYLAELLVNMCSYCLMVKSVSCCCVRGSRLFSNLVTNYIGRSPDLFSSHPNIKEEKVVWLRDINTISQLSTTNDGRVIQCEVVINTIPPIQEVDNIALDVTGKCQD